MRGAQFRELRQPVLGHTLGRAFVTQDCLPPQLSSSVDTDLLPLCFNTRRKRKCKWKQSAVAIYFVYQIGNHLKRIFTAREGGVWRSLHSLLLLVGVSAGRIFLEGNLAICIRSHILWHSISTSRNSSERTTLTNTPVYKDVQYCF